jgi:hypothetical protein
VSRSSSQSKDGGPEDDRCHTLAVALSGFGPGKQAKLQGVLTEQRADGFRGAQLFAGLSCAVGAEQQGVAERSCPWGRPAETGAKNMLASGRYAVAVRPARSELTCHRRAAAAVSQAALAEVLGLRLAKYWPVTPST